MDRWTATHLQGGADLTVMAADGPGTYGLRPWFVTVDELAQWPETANNRSQCCTPGSPSQRHEASVVRSKGGTCQRLACGGGASVCRLDDRRFDVRRVTLWGLAVMAMLVLPATGAMAQTPPDSSRLRGPLQGGGPVFPVDGGTNAALSCRQNANTVLAEVGPGQVEPFELPSFRACVTSLAQGRLSYVAFLDNCRQQEPEFAASNVSGRPYPYSFYGNPNYTAFNRRDCVFFVWSFHTGALPPGPGV